MSDLVVDLFAGPGGADEGIRAAGFAGRLIGVEWDGDACDTAEAAGHERLRADVATVDRTSFAGLGGLWGSPPCQSYSRAGRRLGVDDERGQLVWQPLEWALQLRPRWVALEQVEDVLPIWMFVAAELRAAGYQALDGGAVCC